MRRIALPHHTPNTCDYCLIARKTNLELEQRARRKRIGCLDVDAAPAHIVRMVLDELVDGSALVPHIQADDLNAAIFAGVLGHRSPSPGLGSFLLVEHGSSMPAEKAKPAPGLSFGAAPGLSFGAAPGLSFGAAPGLSFGAPAPNGFVVWGRPRFVVWGPGPKRVCRWPRSHTPQE